MSTGGFGSWSAMPAPAGASNPGYWTTGDQTLPGGAKTFTGGPWTFTRTAVASSAETILTLNVSDDATGKVEVLNSSTSDGQFVPLLRGTAPSTAIGMTVRGVGTTDSGSNAVLTFDARIGTSTAVATRPCFWFLNAGSVLAGITSTSTFFGSAPSSLGSYVYGSQTTHTNTSGQRAITQNVFLSNPSGSSSASTWATYSAARVTSANAQNHTATVGLAGYTGEILHVGSATVTGGACFYAHGHTNSGGGTLANAYGFYCNTLGAGTNRYSFYAVTDIAYFGGGATMNAQVNLKSYTVATLPSAATAGGFIYVSDETGGAVPAFSDATNWRRVTDRAIVA